MRGIFLVFFIGLSFALKAQISKKDRINSGILKFSPAMPDTAVLNILLDKGHRIFTMHGDTVLIPIGDPTIKFVKYGNLILSPMDSSIIFTPGKVLNTAIMESYFDSITICHICSY